MLVFLLVGGGHGDAPEVYRYHVRLGNMPGFQEFVNCL